MVQCSRQDTSDWCDFEIREVPAELVSAVERSAFERRGDFWMRRFPASTPHLDQAWSNFQRLIGPWLRQAAGLEEVPWQDALSEVCRRLNGAVVDWWLTGSGALAARGMPITPGDLDLVVAGPDAHRVGDLFLDGLVEPVASADWFCEWWGRAIIGARVEWVGGVSSAADSPEISDFGPAAAAQLETVRWRGWDVRVPPLALQRAVNARRGMYDRVVLIDSY